jgi:signal transduction histidine kinase
MSRRDDDALVFFALIGMAVVGVYFFGYVIGSFLLVILGIVAFFAFVFFAGVIGAVVSETSKQTTLANYEYNHAVKQNGGSIDGARMKFGNAEVRVEGPRTSFWKGVKYLMTGEEEYSTKLRIGGHEVGKIKVNSNGGFKFKLT